ncbi:beta-1,3-galactosyltransferase brn-like isoform X2 [Panonychus citri]|nr:beta-1,3-galactosyltransferase brn-like isoform X2 [Panonychus citri]
MVNNLQEIIDSHLNGGDPNSLAFKGQSVKPINGYNFSFLIANEDKCRSLGNGGDGDDTAGEDDDGEGGYGNNGETENGNPEAINGLINKDNRLKRTKSIYEKITLVFMIKSALGNRDSRDAIRQTWGREDRFSDVPLRRIFVVGNCEGSATPESADECDKLIGNESREFGDLVQADFIDTYFNNTIKTMMAMKWVVTNCPRTSFVLFVDDDFYISPRNLLRFVRRPFYDPDDLESRHSIPSRFIPKDGRLYAGFVFGKSAPMRHKLSKWYISLEDYPYARYPPYVTAGAFVLSIRTVKEMYYASLYTKHFKFDDIYVGILAKKLNLEPFHNKNFHYWRKSYDPLGYGRVIASHGFNDQSELIKVFLEQKSLGHA